MMHLGHVKGGVGQEQIKGGGGHARRRVLKGPVANKDQARRHGQMAQHGQGTRDDESGIHSFDFRGLLLDQIGEPSLCLVQGRTGFTDRLRRGFILASRHGEQANEQGGCQPRHASRTEIRPQRRPANQGQIDEASNQEIDRPAQEPQVSPPKPG